mgnify:CR=1 FL=1
MDIDLMFINKTIARKVIFRPVFRRHKNNNFILIDPIKEFLGKDSVYKELFIDGVHLTPKGNSLLAKIIKNEISYLFENQ